MFKPQVELLKQVSIFLENRPGQLAEVVSALSDANVNLRALSIAETERFGIMRIITDQLDAALVALDDLDVAHKVAEVVGVRVPDKPGGLADLLHIFDGTDVSVEYMYAELAGHNSHALLVMKLEPRELALQLLADRGLR